MMIEKFYEELKFLDLREGDAISILYRAGAGERSMCGDFAGVTNDFPCRLQLLDYMDVDETWIETGEGMERRTTPKLKSVCYRNIIEMKRYDWSDGLASCDELDQAFEPD